MIEHFLKVIAKSKILGQMDHPNEGLFSYLHSNTLVVRRLLIEYQQIINT